MDLLKDESFKELMLKCEFAKARLETELNILIQEYEFKHGYNPVEHTKLRIKKVDSIAKKLERIGFSVTFENVSNEIHDIVGARIICSFMSDVYEMVEILKSSDIFVIESLEDYIKNPKESGYMSYHVNLRVPILFDGKREYIDAEVQIRTLAMDCWASLDHKLRYKLGVNVPEEVKTELYICSNQMLEIDNEMQGLCDLVKEIKYNEENS